MTTTIPHRLQRFPRCGACNGQGYVRPDGSTFDLFAPSQRGTVASPRSASRPCKCCDTVGLHRDPRTSEATS